MTCGIITHRVLRQQRRNGWLDYAVTEAATGMAFGVTLVVILRALKSLMPQRTFLGVETAIGVGLTAALLMSWIAVGFWFIARPDQR
jgi:hypothetical protein